MDGAARRCSRQRAAANSCNITIIAVSAHAGAANNNLDPSSQDWQRRRRPTNGWATQALGSGRCRGELLLIDLGTLQAPLAGDSSALTAPGG